MDYPKRIMVVGNGGRECALANAMLLSPRVEKLYITPANWGLIDPVGEDRIEVLNIKAADTPGLVAAAAGHSIDLAVVGPENPLCDGLADELRSKGIPTVGPGREAAQLEGSKSYAKRFMDRHGIPTAEYREFTDPDELVEYCKSLTKPVVLKADGLAAGKGVIVCDTPEDAVAAAQRIAVDREFGGAGDLVVVEERLFGDEISWTCLVAGGEVRLLVPSTDYKPLEDGNRGPNTGGMGNMVPTPFATEQAYREFEDKVRIPFEQGLKRDGLDYRGFLFVGTMLGGDGLKVLEFNVRLGDPEAEVVMPVMEADWPLVFLGIANDRWEAEPVLRDDRACVAVVMASGNYPYGPSEPTVIKGLDRIHARGLLTGETLPDGRLSPPPVTVYFAGVGREAAASAGDPGDGTYRPYYDSLGSYNYLATGGRVLAVSALGTDLSDARRAAYEALGNITFTGAKFRSDIAKLR